MCSRGVCGGRKSVDDGVINSPSFLRLNSFIDDRGNNAIWMWYFACWRAVENIRDLQTLACECFFEIQIQMIAFIMKLQTKSLGMICIK